MFNQCVFLPYSVIQHYSWTDQDAREIVSFSMQIQFDLPWFTMVDVEGSFSDWELAHSFPMRLSLDLQIDW